jgi:outer membrane protein TolC
MKVIIFILLIGWSFFTKASELDSLLSWSAKNHPALKAAYKSYEAAVQKVYGTGYLPDPILTFGYFISTPETRTGPQKGSIGMQQIFPWRGTLKAQNSMNVAASKMKFEQFNLLKNQLFQEVKQLYFETEKMSVNIDLLSENIKLLDQIKIIGLSKIEAGDGSTTDILRLDLKINNLETNLKTADINYKGKLDYLKLLTGKERLFLTFKFAQNLANNTLETDTVNNHPMIRMSKEKLNINKARKKVIAQMALPKFGVAINYTFVSKRTDINPIDNGKDILVPKISMTLPIYRKKYKALAKMNDLEKASIEEEIKSKALNLKTKLVMVRVQIKSAKERLKLYKKQIITAESIIELLKADYQNGNTNIEAIFTTLSQLISYQMEQQEAQTDLKIANSKLAFILN